MAAILDEIDRQILDRLQQDARVTNAALAAEVGLTAPSVFERIRKLEQRGVIRRYTVDVDPAALGKTMTAFIRLTTTYDAQYDAGLKAICDNPAVLECYNLAGEDCLIIKTHVSDPSELDALLQCIRTQITVQRSVTMIALSVLKENAPINVFEAAPKAKPRVRSRSHR
jgi:Lrp/AsnC family leucine-responsive transcriptional regulator